MMTELTEFVRQDIVQDLLNRVREGKHTEADARELQAMEHHTPLTQPHLMLQMTSIMQREIKANERRE